MDDVPSNPASQLPDWRRLGSSVHSWTGPSVDSEDLTNEIPCSFISDTIGSFSAYQESRLAQLERFIDPDRLTSTPGSLL